MSSYSGLPSASPPAQDPRPVGGGPHPPTVINAVRLMYLQAVFSLIGLVVLFATKDDLRDKILEDTPNASDSTVDAAITVGAVIGVVITVLYVLLALQVSRGKNWARITTFVLAGLGILSGLVSFGRPAPGLSQALTVIGLVISIAVVVLLALAPSNQYFARRR